MKTITLLITALFLGSFESVAAKPNVVISAERIKLSGNVIGLRFTLKNAARAALTIRESDLPGDNIFTTRIGCLVARSKKFTLDGAAYFKPLHGQSITIKPGGSVSREISLEDQFPDFNGLYSTPGVVILVSWLWCTDNLRHLGVSPKTGTIVFENPLSKTGSRFLEWVKRNGV